MNTRTKLAVAGIVSAVVLGGGFLTQHALAADSTSSTGTSLVAKIAARFNLNQADVQKVFDDNRAEKETAMQQKYSDNLDQLVKNGKITSAQKDLLVNEQKTIQQKMDDIRKMTDATARQQALEQLRLDTQKWAADNNIDLRYLAPFGGFRGHRGGTGMGMM